MSNSLLGSRFNSTPVLVNPSMEAWAAECINAVDIQYSKLTASQMEDAKAFMAKGEDDFWPDEDSWMSMMRPYRVDDAGTLTIPVKGLLLHDVGVQIGGYVTGYTYIRKAFERGYADENVKRIAMVINSGGGEVAGNFDLVDMLYDMRGTKPTMAYLNEHAYSAAYSLASAMDTIVLPRTGGAGSIGVVVAHADRSAEMEKQGVKITFIHAGKHKVEGNQFEPLSEDVKKRMQVRIDGLYNIFVSTISRNLGVAEQSIRDTEALTYGAEESVGLGLAHEIRAYDEAMATFAGESAQTEREEDIMANGTEKETAKTFAQADIDSARSEGYVEGEKAGVKAGATGERERIKGIMGCDEAKDRQKMANHLAFEMSMSVDDAKGLLSNSALEQAPAATVKPKGSGNAFEEAMGTTRNPGVEPEDAEADGGGQEFDPVAFIKSQKATS